MYHFIKFILPIIICLLLSEPAIAAEDDSGLSCFARHLDTDELVEVNTASGIAGEKIALAQWPLGYPTIVIEDSKFVKLPKNVRHFIYYHECAHLQLQTDNERVTDCEALNSLVDKQQYNEFDVRKLVAGLVKETGKSLRWSNLLNCETFPQTSLTDK